MTRLFLRMSLIGLILVLVACRSAEEATPVPEVVATEVIVTETAVLPTETAVPPTPTPIPPTDIPDTPEPPEAEPAATSTLETADVGETTAVSITGIDSGIIAYTNMGDSVDLYALVPDQAPVRMTYGQGLSFAANWSPSGQRIAYYYLDAVSRETDIWYFDISLGPEPMRVTTGDVASNIKRLSWSADSDFLVYDAPQPDGAESDIYRVSVTTAVIVNLTEGVPTWDASPAWSPDGQWIAFVSDRAEAGKASDNIWLMDTEGEQLRQLTNSDASFQEDIEPSWSPDSSQIAFLRHSLLGDSLDPAIPSGLWVVDVATGEERLLVPITGFLVGVQAPVWSPNGRWLAYNAPGLADTDIWVVAAEGGEPVNISNLPGEDASISWAPNSQELIFTNTDGGSTSQIIVAADGSALRLLVESGQNGLGDWSP